MESKKHNIKNLQFRAKFPNYVRTGSLIALSVAVIIAIAGLYGQRSKSSFKLKPEHAQLSTDVVAEINGYERLESENGLPLYLIKADHARTYSDDHQELTNVFIEVFETETGLSDRLTADTALYIPGENKDFTAYLKDNVTIATKDSLRISTKQITYTRSLDIAEADEAVEFERGNLKGKAFGANMDLGRKALRLLRDVEIDIFESNESNESNESTVSDLLFVNIRSRSATFDQINGRLDLADDITIEALTKTANSNSRRNIHITAGNAVGFFVAGAIANLPLEKLEFFGNVRIKSREADQPPIDIVAGYALYHKITDVFELKNGAHIVTSSNGELTDIRAGTAVLDQAANKLLLSVGAVILQGADRISGDEIAADLYDNNKIKHAVVRGNASASQTTAERTMNISAGELNATFDETFQLVRANAAGQSIIDIEPSTDASYTRVITTAAKGIGVSFKGNGLISTLKTDGRTSIQLNVPSSQPDAANKQLTADSVKAVFSANGKDIQRAEAAGNAELSIEPLHIDPRNYRTTFFAPHFNCEFFPTGNNVKTCVAQKSVRTLRTPTVPSEKRGTQTMTTDRMVARFNERSNDLESFETSGNSKFKELGRNAISEKMIYTHSDERIILRGGEPTFWDSRARIKASEIDLDNKNSTSSMRGRVSATYYSQNAGSDASPFSNTEKPFFITADAANFDHIAETGIFLGNARGWQENNFVRGNKILIDQKAGRFISEGSVQSVLYNARFRMNNKETLTQVFASADTMSFERGRRILRYIGGVDIRQGVDRMTSNVAEVYLDDKYEVAKTVVESNVIITQPGRRAIGDWAQYTADDEVAIIRGNPASVSDSVNGSTKTGEIVFRMRENRVTIAGKTPANTRGRSRSVYKVKPDQ